MRQWIARIKEPGGRLSALHGPGHSADSRKGCLMLRPWAPSWLQAWTRKSARMPMSLRRSPWRTALRRTLEPLSLDIESGGCPRRRRVAGRGRPGEKEATLSVAWAKSISAKWQTCRWGPSSSAESACGRPWIRRRGESSSHHGYREPSVGAEGVQRDERGLSRDGRADWDRMRGWRPSRRMGLAPADGGSDPRRARGAEPRRGRGRAGEVGGLGMGGDPSR